MKPAVAGMISVMGVLTRRALGDGQVISGVEAWGYRKALPAVVNPVVRSPLQETV